MDLSRNALDEKFTFILDAGMTIYQWNGRKSPRAVRFKAMEMCRNFNDFQRNCNAQVLSIEQGEEDDDFWAYLSVPSNQELQMVREGICVRVIMCDYHIAVAY